MAHTPPHNHCGIARVEKDPAVLVAVACATETHSLSHVTHTCSGTRRRQHGPVPFPVIYFPTSPLPANPFRPSLPLCAIQCPTRLLLFLAYCFHILYPRFPFLTLFRTREQSIERPRSIHRCQPALSCGIAVFTAVAILNLANECITVRIDYHR